ncbi:MAG: hypothetical protein JW940_23150 [Polyangiaceae bacterium]|nr:hypothetical protein [Polyangiaceae bacterium]
MAVNSDASLAVAGDPEGRLWCPREKKTVDLNATVFQPVFAGRSGYARVPSQLLDRSPTVSFPSRFSRSLEPRTLRLSVAVLVQLHDLNQLELAGSAFNVDGTIVPP